MFSNDANICPMSDFKVKHLFWHVENDFGRIFGK